MFKILKSEFERLGISVEMIEKFAAEKRSWLNHMQNVERTKDEQDPMKKYEPFPPPTSLPLVMNAVTDDGQLWYEIEDDTHIQVAETFENRKNELFLSVKKVEQEETEKRLPRGKARLISLHETRIQTADTVLQTATLAAWDNAAKKGDTTLHDAEEMNAVLEQGRPQEDTAFIEEITKIRADIEKITWWAAEQESAIADLTPETIDEWVMAPLPM